MTINRKAQAAWEQVQKYLRERGNAPVQIEDLPPQVQYVLRRIMGLGNLGTCDRDFVQAWNESPIVDADEDEVFYADILVRPHEPKDGVR